MIYKEAGMKGVVIQPKYMGSYCDIYLHRDIEKTRFYSRRGYPLQLKQELDLVSAVRSLHDRIFNSGLETFVNAEMVIIQSELMPWRALGGRLIDRNFGGYRISHQIYQEYLASTDLGQDIEKLRQDSEYQQFLIDQNTMDRKDLRKKYPAHVVSQYEALQLLEIPDSAQYQKDINVYSEQLDLYGSDGELNFKPFNILKIIFEDNSEKIFNDHLLGFRMVSDDKYLYFEFNDETLEADIQSVYDFFDELVADNMEGIIIKPIGEWNPDIVPMFKIRNNNYLQMIYGVNYQRDYDYYLSRRSVGKKMRASRNQWAIAQEVLNIPMDQIGNDNQRYVELVRGRIYEEDFEKLLDSRL
jgi:hypothetical protein